MKFCPKCKFYADELKRYFSDGQLHLVLRCQSCGLISTLHHRRKKGRHYEVRDEKLF